MTTAVAEAPASVRSTAATILSRAVCLTLECHQLGNHRTVDLRSVVKAATAKAPDALDFETPDVELPDHFSVDEKMFNTVKRLVDPAQLRPANRIFNLAKAYLRTRAIPTHRVFGERSYLIPLALVEEVDAKLADLSEELRFESRSLAFRYTTAVAEQAAKLGPLFNARDYKTPSEVEAAFGLDWSYVSFAAPEKLETVDRALFELAQTKYQTKMAAAYGEVRLVLRETLRQLTADIVRKLTPGPSEDGGKRKIFRSTILTDLADFLATFDFRNLTDDGELTAVVTQLRSLTHGIDPTLLRNMDSVRTAVLTDLRAATDQLDQLVATGRRAISFDSVDA